MVASVVPTIAEGKWQKNVGVFQNVGDDVFVEQSERGAPDH